MEILLDWVGGITSDISLSESDVSSSDLPLSTWNHIQLLWFVYQNI